MTITPSSNVAPVRRCYDVPAAMVHVPHRFLIWVRHSFLIRVAPNSSHCLALCSDTDLVQLPTMQKYFQEARLTKHADDVELMHHECGTWFIAMGYEDVAHEALRRLERCLDVSADQIEITNPTATVDTIGNASVQQEEFGRCTKFPSKSICRRFTKPIFLSEMLSMLQECVGTHRRSKRARNECCEEGEDTQGIRCQKFDGFYPLWRRDAARENRCHDNKAACNLLLLRQHQLCTWAQ